MNRAIRMFRRKRVLVVALAAGALLAAPTAAYAEDNRPADPDVRCAARVGPGEYEFYLPGERVTDKYGQKWVCGPDGMWFKDYSALTVIQHPVSQVATSAVLAP